MLTASSQMPDYFYLVIIFGGSPLSAWRWRVRCLMVSRLLHPLTGRVKRECSLDYWPGLFNEGKPV